MDDVADGDDMHCHAVVDQQATLGIQINGHPGDEATVGERDPDARAQGRRVAPQLEGEGIVIGESIRQPLNQCGQKTIPVGISATVEKRRGPLERCGAHVHPDTNHDGGFPTRYELGQDARQLAGLGAVDHHQIVGPLQPNGRRHQPAGSLTSCRGHRADHFGCRSSIGRHSKTHQQMPAWCRLPHTVQAAPPFLLEVGHEHGWPPESGAGLVGEIDIGGTGRRHVAQTAEPGREGLDGAAGEGFWLWCRIRGVHWASD